LDEEDYNGYFAYWTHKGFIIVDSESRTKEPFEVDSNQNDRSKRKDATSLLVMHLINTSLGAEPQKPGL